jgi:hypothetical protein
MLIILKLIATNLSNCCGCSAKTSVLSIPVGRDQPIRLAKAFAGLSVAGLFKKRPREKGERLTMQSMRITVQHEPPEEASQGVSAREIGGLQHCACFGRYGITDALKGMQFVCTSSASTVATFPTLRPFLYCWYLSINLQFLVGRCDSGPGTKSLYQTDAGRRKISSSSYDNEP